MSGSEDEPEEAAGSRSPYVDPATGFLRNEVAATSQEQLREVWADRVLERLEPIAESSIPCTGDREHLQAIHRLHFAGVFDWAGQFRKTNIDKQGTHFVPADQIDAETDRLFAELAAEDLLRGLPKEQFVARLAHYYARLNHIHPFREGNGRTQRLFWWHVSLHAGWSVDVVRFGRLDHDKASRVASQDGDLGPLIALLTEVTEPAPSIERGTANLLTAVRRRERRRRFSRWLRSHANPARLRPPGPSDGGSGSGPGGPR